MKKINFKFIIITMIICLLPMIFGIAMYNQLPDKMAVHFDINNEPNNFFPKAVAVFGLPIFMSLFQLICCVMTDLGKKENSSKLEKVAKWVLPVTSIVLYITTIIFNLGIEVDVRKIACLLIGIIIILMGNYLPKVKSGDYINIHPKALVENEKIWRKYSRALGYTYVISGVLIAISILFQPIVSAIVVLLFIVSNLLVTVFSVFFVKEEK